MKILTSALSILIYLMSFNGLHAQIKTGDVLEISIKGVPAKEKTLIEGNYVVDQDGQIKIPLADVMTKAAGLDHAALSRSIEKVYREKGIYVHPAITVQGSARQIAEGARLSVGGKVKRPGPIPFRERMTLMQAIQAAGDLDLFGSKKRVFLTRKGKAIVLDLRKPEHQNYLVRPDDTIVVDQKNAFE